METPSLAQLFFGRFANVFRARRAARRRQRPQLCTLEPRLLLSADLIGSVEFHPDAAPILPGDGEQATVVVRNIGNATASGPAKVSLYASADGVLDANDILLATGQAPKLKAAASSAVNLGFSAPELAPGEYSLIAKVNSDNKIAESNEANNVAVGPKLALRWMFGNVQGHGPETLTVRDADGTGVLFSLTGPGTGEVVLDHGQWDLRVTGTSDSSVLSVLTLGGGDGRVALDDIQVGGALGGMIAPNMDLTGTLAVKGPLTAGLMLGSATHAVIAAPTILGTQFLGLSIKGIAILGDIEDSQILIGADLGADGQLGGTGAAADTYSAANLGDLLIAGSITSSSVRVGQDPVNGIFDDCDDVIQGGEASRINGIAIGGSLSADSHIIAGRLPAMALVHLRLIPTAGDARFKTDVAGPQVELALANDTGAPGDKLTSDPRIAGTATDPSGIVSLRAGFGGSANVDITDELGAGGSFLLSRADLEEIFGAALIDGTYTLTVEATDGQGNACPHTFTFTLDATSPAVRIDQAAGQEDPTNDSPISFTVLFSEAVTGFSASDVSFAGSTVGGALVANVTGSGTTYTVAVSGMSGDGTVAVSIPGAAANDAAGNANTGSTSTDNMVRFDGVAPTVRIDQAAGQEDPTNDSPISFTVLFSEAVFDFSAADVSLAGSTVGGTLGVEVSGAGASYTVLVSGMNGSGTVVASVVAGAAHDAAGNASAASTSTDNTVALDNVAPTVTIDQAVGQADPTNGSPVLFTVQFSEAVTNFSGSDVSFAGSTVGGALVADVTGSGMSYTVAVSGMSGDGLLMASIPGAAAADAAGNLNTASTSIDNVVRFDNVAPTVAINQAPGQQDPTDVGPISFSVLFSEAVTGFGAQDVSFAGSTVGGTLVANVSGSGTSYTVTVTGMDGTGALVASVPAAAALDAAGNASTASTSVDNTVSFDNATGRPFIFIGDATVVEGNSGTASAVFTVSLSAAALVPVSVAFSTSNSSAVSASDYTSRSGSLTFAPGVTTQTVSVQVAGDTAIESDEFFYVDLSNPVNAIIADPQGFGTIVDNDGRYGLSINDTMLVEAGNGTTQATFTVYLPIASSDPVSVNFATRDGSAKAGSDYVSTSGTVTIAPGATQSSITVTVLGDSEAEVEEEFSVLLSGAVNAVISDPQGVATIFSDDRLPRFAITDAVVAEGSSGTTNALFKVTLSAPASVPATVNFATHDGPDSHFGADAVAPGDYTATSGMLTFAPGVTTQTILVPVAGDLEAEEDEWFHVSLSNSTGGATLFDTGVDGVGEARIVNDELQPPELSSRGGFLIEGNSGTANALLTVFLTHASPVTVTVDYETFNAPTADAATAGTDYTPVSGTLTFAPGVTTRTISVPVIGDTTSENIEDIGVRFTNEVNASVSTYSIIEIIDNDGSAPLPVLSVRGTGLAEGDSGTTSAIYTALLSKPATTSVSFNYQTSDIPGNGTKAIAGEDYISTSGTLTFAPGETIKTIAVPIVGDIARENDEIFQLNVGGFVGLTQDVLGPTYVKIFDDDESLVLRVADAVLFEPTSGTSDAVFNVVLSRPVTYPVTVNYAATGAGAGTDYVATSGSLTFSPGVTTGSFAVPVLADTLVETREGFPVQLGIEGGSGGFVGFIQILDNSRTPVLAIDNGMVIEGDSGVQQAAFTVYLSEASALPVTVNYATADGSATAGSDYTATSGSLQFAPGTTRQTILVPVAGDTATEALETFTVRLSGAANALIVGFPATGTILDNDRPQALPQLRIGDVSVEEGDSGPVNAVFTVGLSAASPTPITFRYETANGTARAGSDYIAASDLLTFAAGTTSQTITVPILPDTTFEGDETFWVRFATTPTNAAVADNFGVGTIVNDDPNTPPVAQHGVLEAFEDGPAVPGQLAATDVESALSFSLVGLPTKGVVSLNAATGAYTYTPNVANFNGLDSFSFKANDGLDDSNVATVTVTILPVNDAPEASADSFDTYTDVPLVVIDFAATHAFDWDHGDTLSIVLDSAAHGTAIYDGSTDSLTYTPDAGYRGSDSFEFTVTDSYGLSSSAVIDVTITEQPVAPVAADAHISTEEDTSIGGVLQASDANADPLAFAIVAGPLHGSAVLIDITTGDFTYSPAPDFYGEDSFTFLASDGSLDSNIATVSITVNPVNDAPVLEPIGNKSTTVGQQLTFQAVASDLETPAGLVFSLTGSVPSGASITPSGLFTWTPSAGQAGTSQITVRVADGGSPVLTDQETISVHAAALPRLGIDDVTVVEGVSGTSAAVFRVLLSGPSAEPVTVNYATQDGTAVAPGDYTAVSGTLTFAPGETVKTIAVPVVGDAVVEGVESFSVVLSGAGNAEISDAQASGTILDDALSPRVVIGDGAVVEGNSGTQNMTFTVQLSGASSVPVTVSYASSNVSNAKAGVDYTAVSGTLTFAPGVTSQTIAVPVLGDTVTEGDEFFQIQLSGAVNAFFDLFGAVGSGQIIDDEFQHQLMIGDAEVYEGDPATLRPITFDVLLTAPSSVPVTVDYGMFAGTASPSDFAGGFGTLTFNPGETVKQITTLVFGDDTNEEDETFTVRLFAATNAAISDRNTGVGVILNDDLPQLGITNAPAVLEPDAGTQNMVFTVSLSKASSQTVTVAYATESASGIAQATAPGDYGAVSGVLTFAPGVTSQTITVQVSDDTALESEEALAVRLSNPVNAKLLDDGLATGRILDNDLLLLPKLEVSGTTVIEGNSGTRNAVFTVFLSHTSSVPITASYQTSSDNVAVPATAGSDYTAVSGTLTFAPGETIKTVAVPVIGDAVVESDESFRLSVAATANVSSFNVSGIADIINDEPLPRLGVDGVTVIEGDSGTAAAVFTVLLTAPSPLPVTVNYQTFNGTAIASQDYTAVSGTLTFAPGVTSQTVSVPVLADTNSEAQAETFTLVLNLPGLTNATIANDRATATIIDQDGLASARLGIDDVTVVEGVSGTSAAVFRVLLSGPSAEPVTVNYATQDGTAVAPGDYTAVSGTLTFAPGETVKTIAVPVVGDAVVEGVESFSVVLSGAGNAEISDAQASGTILDDALSPRVVIGDGAVVEGNSGTQNMTFTVQLSGASSVPVTVSYASSNVSNAKAGVDYTAVSGTLTFAPGVTSQTIAVPVLGDTVTEGDEFFQIQLSGAVNAFFDLFGAVGSGQIIDDEFQHQLMIGDAEVYEGDPATLRPITFDVLLTAPSSVPVTVDYGMFAGTASPSDFAGGFGTLTFNPGETVKQITTLVFGDDTNEEDETFTVRLFAATNAAISDRNTGVGVILNDDLPQLGITNAPAVLEPDAGTQNMVFTVSLSKASSQTVTVAYATESASGIAQATAPGDYGAVSGVLTFAPGVTSQTITVQVSDDTALESEEALAVRLSNPVNAKLLDDGLATGRILDNDLLLLPKLEVSGTTVIEGNSGTRNAVFTVFLSHTSSVPITASYQTSSDNVAVPATAGSDYTAVSGTLTFAPGETIKTVAVPVIGDAVVESDESFRLSVAATANVSSFNVSGIADIINDEPLPRLGVDGVTVIEGDSGTAAAVFTVLLTAPSPLPVTVNYQTFNGTAIASQDYTAVSGTLTFAPGVTSQTVSVPVLADTNSEAQAETFTLVLNLPGLTNATIANDRATATIIDEDGPGFMVVDAVRVGATDAVLVEPELDSIANSAISSWRELLGEGDARLTLLEGLSIGIAQFAGPELGSVEGSRVLIDADGAGYGWFVDSTPADNAEFVYRADRNVFEASFASEALGRMDLVTVVVHEIGHLLGFTHEDAALYPVMRADLAPGARYALEAPEPAIVWDEPAADWDPAFSGTGANFADFDLNQV